MSRRIYAPRLLIENIEYEIAIREAEGKEDQAEGIRSLFRDYVNEENISQLRDLYRKAFEDIEEGVPFSWGRG